MTLRYSTVEYALCQQCHLSNQPSTDLKKTQEVHPIEKLYGLEVDDAAFIRGQVESIISRMVNLMDMTERQTVRGLWHDATLGDRETHRGSIATAVDLIGATDARVPLIVKSVAIIHVCHAAKGLPPEKHTKLWQSIHEAFVTEPDDIQYFILMGSLIGGLTSMDSDTSRYEDFQKELNTRTNKNTAVARFGIQVATARLAQLIHADKLHLGLFTVSIAGGNEKEHRSSHGLLGYPDTIMILSQPKMPSEDKMKEAVAVGVPGVGVLTKRSLMAMVGMEQNNSGAGSGILDYPHRTWSFLSVGSVSAVDRMSATHKFVPDALTLWVAVRVAEKIGSSKKVSQKYIQARIHRMVEGLGRKIEVMDIESHEKKSEHGILHHAHSEILSRVEIRNIILWNE